MSAELILHQAKYLWTSYFCLGRNDPSIDGRGIQVMIGDQTFNVDSSKGTLVVNPSKQNKKQLISPRYEPIVTGFVLAASVQRENLDLPAFLQELDLRGHHYSSEVRYYLMWSDIQRHAVSIHFLCREFWILSKGQPE